MTRMIRTVVPLVLSLVVLSSCEGGGVLDSTTTIPPTTDTPSLTSSSSTMPTTTSVSPTTTTLGPTTPTQPPPPTTSTTTTTTTTATTTTTTTVSPRPEYVNVLASGLDCDDFTTEDLGWQVAIGYWFMHGRPSRMDGDGDGIPCEEIPFPITHEDGTRGTIVWGEHLWIDSFRPGMLCRDLVTEHHHPDYWEAVLYWLSEGEPARMDADRDGIPCETVYPESFIRQFLEDPRLPVPGWNSSYDELDKGLYCRDLIWYLPFYRQALGYFYNEGFPSRMDADGNGVPCETVYEEATQIADQDRATFPTGLTCEDLAEHPSWYPTVAMYWLIHGKPADLDPDGDGYPCSPGWPWPDDVEYFKDGSPSCCAG